MGNNYHVLSLFKMLILSTCIRLPCTAVWFVATPVVREAQVGGLSRVPTSNTDVASRLFSTQPTKPPPPPNTPFNPHFLNSEKQSQLRIQPIMSKMWEVDPETRSKVRCLSRCARGAVESLGYNGCAQKLGVDSLLNVCAHSYWRFKRRTTTISALIAMRRVRNGYEKDSPYLPPPAPSIPYATATVLRPDTLGLSQARHLHVSFLLRRPPRSRRTYLLHPQHNHGRFQGR